MNAELGRRTFIRTAAATGVAAAGTTWAAEAASAAPGGPNGGATGSAAGPGAHESALRDARMVWSQAPRDRSGAPFLGDNALAVQVFLRPDGKALRFSLGTAGPGWDSAPAFLDLVPAGAVTSVRLELDLWNAELTGMVGTTSGAVAVRAFVPRGRGVLLVTSTAAGGERTVRYATGPEGAAGSGVTRAVRQSGTRAVVTATAGPGDVRAALEAGEAALTGDHRAWWHAFYSRSHLSVPDRTVQRFHWLQLYTAAALLSPRAPLAASAPTLLNRSAHTGLGGAAAAAAGGGLPPGTGHLNWATPGAGSKAGPSENLLLAWGVPQAWDAYRHTGDENVLREVLHPLLRKAVGFYAGYLVPGADGHLHLPATYSPGYGDVVDATHDLALLRWAAAALVESTRRLGLSDPGLKRWQDVAARLAPYHQDADGVAVGAGVRLSRSHARAGHLLWLFPLYEKRWSRPDDRALMTSSFDHWASMRQDWDGRSYAVGASMAAAVHRGGEAHTLLRRLLDGEPTGLTGLLPNAMGRAKDGTSDLATSFAAGQAVLDLLVAGDPDVVDVFPGVPDEWADASVFGLRAPGAFVVDAARSRGRTDWVRVGGAAGRTLTLRHGVEADVDIRVEKAGTSRPADARSTAPGTCVLRLDAGESVVVARRGAVPGEAAQEVPANGGGRHWGGAL
ncbi:glycosyl hydrolase family 95 catalytic domain-containing protein [Actinacidiphila acidipaludis]|uniref:Glycosyl hydrolase family 95 catalytic domain-containing protein n=1 Tax=Actinacidiphila acidipaludis TaxID=2873382 RepID=A0ABS7Q5Y4_9ACTN|nr:hypothetical protein [Streptomyces acidipaludis]MBY8877412.1 hypothetical protein [Streptomyces acidipaludis]